ncbi:MAG TPA: glycosyltransferase [Verrucomicrobiota bacterium]|nr:hypothetical protein [Verrucomicrobiales bacterium]HRI15299.1 glycosyltransferase [Verrucomicrobiota bacterium]
MERKNSPRAHKRSSIEAQPHEALSPPVTLCVICYGPHVDLARRFLESLYSRTDPLLFNLRAGLNEVEPATSKLFDEFATRYGNIELFVEPRNIFKNPLMRRMFNEKPLTSRWTIWCDDDTHFTRKDWLEKLGRRIQKYPQVSLWGALYFLTSRKPQALKWIRTARWYRRVPFKWEVQDDGTKAVRFVFATGGFWAMRTEVLQQLDWPDPRLVHAGEDVLLSEALRQNGHPIGHFEQGVRINDAPRRNPSAPEVVKLTPPGRVW